MAINLTQIDQATGPATVKMSDLVAKYCTGLDDKIILASSLILLYFLFHNIILPFAHDALKELLEKDFPMYSWIMEDYLTPFYNRMISVIETLGLGGALFLVGYQYYHGWPWYTWAIAIGGGVALALILLSKLIGYIRRRRSK